MNTALLVARLNKQARRRSRQFAKRIAKIWGKRPLYTPEQLRNSGKGRA